MGRDRAEIEDWPEEASVLVTETFTETGGTPRAFSVFLDAEIENGFGPVEVAHDD